MNPRIDAYRAGCRPLRALCIALLALFVIARLGDNADGQRRHHHHHRSHKKRKPAAKKPAAASPAAASPAPVPSKGADDKAAKGKEKEKGPVKLDFSGLDLAGRLRTPQLLYFLDRASAELEAASLERRSFVPEMVRSIDEESL